MADQNITLDYASNIDFGDYGNNKRFDLYRKSYSPQKSKLEGGNLIVFYGPSCSGKTTIGKIIADMYSVHRVSLDLIRYKYFKDEKLFTDKNNREVFDLFVKILDFLIKEKQSVICEGILASAERIEKLQKIHSNICFIYFTASLEILNDRLDKRYINMINSEIVGKETLQKEHLQDFYSISSPLNDNVINTETLNEKKAVKLVKKIIERFYKC